LSDSQVEVDDGILTDAYLQSSVSNIYAAGDVARRRAHGAVASFRMQHWTSAQEQGALAAANLLDPASARPHDADNYVWSDQHGQRLQVVGNTGAGEIRFLTGGPGSDTYLAVKVLDELIVGAVGFGAGKLFRRARTLVAKKACWRDAAELTWSRA
jgi:NADPH-dependent 2,4-dienoyl-CoA reductase/sulfur reductase-like enzyme